MRDSCDQNTFLVKKDTYLKEMKVMLAYSLNDVHMICRKSGTKLETIINSMVTSHNFGKNLWHSVDVRPMYFMFLCNMVMQIHKW